MKFSVKIALFIAGLLTACSPLLAHQLVLTTGYANSRTPSVGPGIDEHHPLFRAGSGYAFGTRVDVDSPSRRVVFGPAFCFWNNLTGDPDPNANANYFQIELGGRVAARTRTIPSLYAGVGAGYTLAHGEVVELADGRKQTFDGEFPTGSLHFGVKSASPNGLAIIAEGSFHFGLEKPQRRLAVGPAAAWVVQIGVGFDLLLSTGS